MAIDFPSSPAAGQVFNVSPGVSFVYRNGLWVKAPLTTALPKNYIINPCMQVSEENGTTATTTPAGTNTYMLDQWRQTFLPGNSWTMQQLALVTPLGSPYRMRGTVAATAGTVITRYLQLGQPIEGYRVADLAFGTANAKQIIVTFGFRSSLTGNFDLVLRSNVPTVANTAYAVQFNVPTANVDAYYTFVIPGCTIGTWATDNTLGLEVAINIFCGSGQTGSLNFWGTNNGYGYSAQGVGVGAVFDIFDVGLYADPYKTGVAPPFVIPDTAVETRRGQRYWYKCFGLHGVVINGTTSASSGARHPVPMRATPTPSIKGAPKFYDGTVTPSVSSFINSSNAYAAEFDITTSGTAFATVGKATSMYYQSLNDYIAMNARM